MQRGRWLEKLGEGDSYNSPTNSCEIAKEEIMALLVSILPSNFPKIAVF